MGSKKGSKHGLGQVAHNLRGVGVVHIQKLLQRRGIYSEILRQSTCQKGWGWLSYPPW